MKHTILVLIVLGNAGALFCPLNPWIDTWHGQGIVFLVSEAVFLVLIGVPVFIHHWRKGLALLDALTSSLDAVMSFPSGWV
ncbi:MAG: hypothetical protein AB1733_19540 [Thermodesulfobacteriota bacterium]